MKHRLTDDQLAFARRLRREMTVAETMLWRSLRNRGIGAKFRRQMPIGPYVADFACISARLIVELDGPPHDDPRQHAHDSRRDAWLKAQGWRVLRFANDIVIGGGDIVTDAISQAIASQLPSCERR